MKKFFQLLFVFLSFVSIGFTQSLRDAVIAIDAEQYQKATRYLKGLVRNLPDQDPSYYYYLSRVYLLNQYIDSAKATAKKSIQIFPKKAIPYISLGAVNLEEGNKQGVEESFAKAKSLMRRKDFTSLQFLAKTYLSSNKHNNPDSAIFYLNKARKINNSDAQIYLELGNAYAEKTNNSQAIANYEQALAIDKNLYRAKLKKGIIWRMAYNWKKSVQELNQLIKAVPNYGPAYRELAETYLGWAEKNEKSYKELINKAVTAYKQYLDLTDLSEGSKMRYADFLILAKRWEDVEKISKELEANKEKNLKIYRYLGYASYKNKKYQDAYQALNKFIKNVEKSRVIDLDYFYFYKIILDGNLDVGFDIFDHMGKILVDFPQLAGFVKELANTFYKEKDYIKAAKCYQTYVDHVEKPKLADQFKLGSAYYWAANYSISAKLGEDVDKVEINAEEDKWLQEAKKQFEVVNSRSKKPIEQIYIYLARMAYFYDPEAKKGLQKPYFEKFIQIVKNKLINEKNANILCQTVQENNPILDGFKKANNIQTIDCTRDKSLILNYLHSSNNFLSACLNKFPKLNKKYKKRLGAAFSYLGFYYEQKKEQAKALENFKVSYQIDNSNKQAKYYVNIYEKYEQDKAQHQKELDEFNKKKK